jgi:hypothetical protein
MIFGRPANLILAAVTAIFNAVVLILAALVPPVVIDAGVVSGINFAAAAIIALVANTPPTLAPGDTYHVATPPGQPDGITRVVTRTTDPAEPGAGIVGPDDRRSP